MYNNGFIKVSTISPELKVGNPKYNVDKMLEAISNLKSSFAVFPELCVTGYTCADLFFQDILLEEALAETLRYVRENKFKGVSLIGLPLEINGSLYNVALVIKDNKILGAIPKQSIPNTREFYERRWFKSGRNAGFNSININGELIPFGDLIFKDDKHSISFGVEICEDMWAPISPANLLAYQGCNLIFNLSASNEVLGKSEIRRTTVLESSRKNSGAYIYSSAGINESTSDTVFSGHSIIAVCGKLIKENESFSTNTEIITGDIDIKAINFQRRNNANLHDAIPTVKSYQTIEFSLIDSNDYSFEERINTLPFVPNENKLESFQKISAIQEYALYKRMKHTNAKTLVIGVSGGLDSTLALLVAVKAFKHLGKNTKDIIAVTMPGFGTSERTKSNALQMMSSLGVTLKNIPIDEEALLHFKMIGQDKENKDITYENTQARIRTMILMNLANKENGIVLGTGDMSELALGWCTYNGDQMSMYGINAGLPKTLVRFMVEMYAKHEFKDIKDTLLDVVDTPISPELSSSSQKTEDSVGKYEINDFILYEYLVNGANKEKINYMLEMAFDLKKEEASSYTQKFFSRFFSQQFKRQALPDGPKVLEVSLSPRGDYRMPSDIGR